MELGRVRKPIVVNNSNKKSNFAGIKLPINSKQWRVWRIRLLILFGFIAVIAGFSLLRHRELCTYNTLVSRGQAVNSWGNNICPNLLDTGSWGQLVVNAFNPFTLQGTSINNSAYGQLAKTDECSDQLNPICILAGKNQSELKQSDGKTNLLVVGVDSRDGYGSIANTDSLMLISYDHNSGSSLLISFPRDLYVEYKKTDGSQRSSKINAIYASTGTEGLDSAISQVTGKPVHYHVYIAIETFASIVDKIGGIEIELEEDFADVYPCKEVPANKTCPQPRYVEDGIYGYFKFAKGKHTFDSFDALVYARARKYSSDFKRAARQQKLVKAVLNNVLKGKESLVSRIPQYLDLYNLFKNEVKTNIELKDLAAAGSLAQKINDNVARIVVDPNLGGYNQLVTPGGIVDGVWRNEFHDKSYGQFQQYIAKTWEFLPYYIENPKILVINQSSSPIPADSALQKFIDAQIPYREIKVESKPQLSQTGEQVRIYNLKAINATSSIRDIQKRIPGSLVFSPELDGITRSTFGEHILIVYTK